LACFALIGVKIKLKTANWSWIWKRKAWQFTYILLYLCNFIAFRNCRWYDWC